MSERTKHLYKLANGYSGPNSAYDYTSYVSDEDKARREAADAHKMNEHRKGISDYDKLRLAGDAVSHGIAPVTGEKSPYGSWWDNLRAWWSGDAKKQKALQSDPTYIKNVERIAEARSKAYANYTKDKNGNWVEVPDKIDNIQKQTDSLRNKHKGNNSEYHGTADAVRKGFEKGYKGSIGFGDVMQNPRGAFKLWAQSNNFGEWATKFADNPVLFWGSLLAGGIGIAGLVSAFIGSRKPQGTTVNNYYGSYSPQRTVPPASTSFWRLNNDQSQ